MTGKTQFPAFFIKEIFVFGGMRRMAGKASFSTGHRGMVKSDLLTFLLMAIETKSISFFENKPGILRGMGLMARVAHSFLKWGVVDLSPGLQG
jgi:hypothetical protein